MIPVMKPYFTEDEFNATRKAIESGWVTQGPRVEEFENQIAKYCNVKHAIAVNSCTAGMHISFLALGIGKGDEVIVPSYTYIATPNSVIHAGAKPIFVDINKDTYNIDVNKIEEKITEKTKAIMPVHQVGLSADLDPIKKLCQKYNLAFVDDAACALGAEYKDQKIGSLTQFTSFSFHPRKSITTGEGGMMTTNDDELARLARMYRFHGASVSSDKRHFSSKVVIEDFPVIGYNYKMSDINAVVGIEQFKKIDFILKERRRLAQRYNDLFANNSKIIVPFVPSYAKHTYQSYVIGFNSEKNQIKIMEELLEKGISVRAGIMASHETEVYKKLYGKIDLPVTEYATRHTLILPLFIGLKEEEQDYVVKSIKEVL